MVNCHSLIDLGMRSVLTSSSSDRLFPRHRRLPVRGGRNISLSSVLTRQSRINIHGTRRGSRLILKAAMPHSRRCSPNTTYLSDPTMSTNMPLPPTRYPVPTRGSSADWNATRRSVFGGTGPPPRPCMISLLVWLESPMQGRRHTTARGLGTGPRASSKYIVTTI